MPCRLPENLGRTRAVLRRVAAALAEASGRADYDWETAWTAALDEARNELAGW